MASIQKDKKTGKWFCRVPYKDKFGEYKTKTKKGFDTKREAQLYAKELENQLSDGIDFNRDEIIFADYFEEWVEVNKIPTLTITTVKKYEFIVKLVHEHFGVMKLKDLTRTRYQRFITQRGKNRSKDTVEKTHFAIKSCMKDALYDKLIDRDPTYKAVLTYDVKPQSRLKYWNVNELAKLIEYFEKGEHQIDTLFYLLATTGMRIGEAYGLAWNDVDGNQVTIKRGYNHSHKIFTDGKNTSSLRTIQIDDKTKSMLNRYRMKYRKICSDYLFIDNFKKTIMTHTGSVKYLKSVCKKLQVQELTPHAFRHSHCSYLLFNGVDIQYVSKRLGHSTVLETQKTYSHILDEMNTREKERTMEAINKLLSAN